MEIEGAEWRIPSERSKTGGGHLVPLSPLAMSLIDNLPRFGADGYVFTTTDGEKPVSGWSKAKRRLDHLIDEARIAAGTHQIPEWHLHDLRRTSATGMRSLGTDRLVVSKVLNHAEAGITKVYDRYAADREKRNALEAWAVNLEIIVSPVDDGVAAQAVQMEHSALSTE